MRAGKPTLHGSWILGTLTPVTLLISLLLGPSVGARSAFALDLYARLKAKPGESPYSISTALAMTYSGARGTAGEF